MYSPGHYLNDAEEDFLKDVKVENDPIERKKTIKTQEKKGSLKRK